MTDKKESITNLYNLVTFLRGEKMEGRRTVATCKYNGGYFDIKAHNNLGTTNMHALLRIRRTGKKWWNTLRVNSKNIINPVEVVGQFEHRKSLDNVSTNLLQEHNRNFSVNDDNATKELVISYAVAVEIYLSFSKMLREMYMRDVVSEKNVITFLSAIESDIRKETDKNV